MELSSDGDLEGSNNAGKASWPVIPYRRNSEQLLANTHSHKRDKKRPRYEEEEHHNDDFDDDDVEDYIEDDDDTEEEDSSEDESMDSVDETSDEEDDDDEATEMEEVELERRGEYFDLIPDEVLYYVIFKHLDIVDLLRIDLTCKKWYHMISKFIVEFDLLKTVGSNGDSKLSPLLLLVSSAARSNISFTPPKNDDPIISQHPVRSLLHVEDLSLCGIADDSILGHLESLSNLKRLAVAFSKLTSVGIDNLSKLSNLTHLSLIHCGYDRTCLSKINSLRRLRGLVELQVTKDMPLGIRMALKGLPLTVPQHCIPP